MENSIFSYILQESDEDTYLKVPFLKNGTEAINLLIPNTKEAKKVTDYSIEIGSTFVDINKKEVLKLFHALNLFNKD